MQSVFLRGHNPFELMDYDGLLTEFYANTMSFGPALHYAQELVNQIAHRFQNMDILEIGMYYLPPLIHVGPLPT